MRWSRALAVGAVALAAAAVGGVVTWAVTGNGAEIERTGQVGVTPTPTPAPEPVPDDPSGGDADVVATPISFEGLRSYTSCGAFLEDVQSHALELVGPWGIEQYGLGRGIATTDVNALGAPVAEEAAAEPAPAEAVGDSSGTPGFSGTNIQEVGVDEPDIAKTDGELVYAIAQGRLWVTDTGPVPRVLDSIQLEGWDHRLLLLDDRVLVLAQGDSFAVPHPEDAPAEEILPAGWAQTTMTLVDVSDPQALEVLESLTVEGVFVSARQTGETARVVVSSFPTGLEFTGPIRDGFLGEIIATTQNRGAVAQTTAADWLPGFVHHDLSTGATTSGLASCEGVHRPETSSGLGMLTVLTIDVPRGLEPVDTDSVMTDGQLVYASPTSLYVATQQWIDWNEVGRRGAEPQGLTSLIHKFSIDDPTSTEYVASGEVRGYLLNQFSMSEHDGHLRVATTDQPAWFGGGESESYVTVLEERGGNLKQVGQVGDLGRGEQIFAVRFFGDIGYVVTFRQVDPLYTIDLSDPTRPTVRGELKILGYSAYLHPVGDGLLLGIGQDADRNGRLKGTQLSLFDVSNLDDPIRLHAEQLGRGSSSEVEYDHHAFLWWAPEQLAVLPVSGYDEAGAGTWFSAAVGSRVERGPGIEPVGAITHPDGSQVRRSIVVGDSILTVSDSGIKSSDLDSFIEQGWTPFN